MSHKNGPAVTVVAASDLPENPSIAFTLPRDLVKLIDTRAIEKDVSRAQVCREIIAREFTYELPIVARGRISSMIGMTDAEKAAELKRRSILAIIESRAQKLALSVDVMNAIKNGRMLTADEVAGAIMRHVSDLTAEYEKKNSCSLSAPIVTAAS